MKPAPDRRQGIVYIASRLVVDAGTAFAPGAVGRGGRHRPAGGAEGGRPPGRSGGLPPDGVPRRRDPARAGQRAHPPADPAVHRRRGDAAADPAIVRRLDPPRDRLEAGGGPGLLYRKSSGRPPPRRSPSAPRRWGRSPGRTFPRTTAVPCGRGSSRKGSASLRTSPPRSSPSSARRSAGWRRSPRGTPSSGRECPPTRCTPSGKALLRSLADLAAAKGLPACLHLAESAPETAFLSDGGGEIASRLYPAVGKDVSWFRGLGRSIPAYLAEAGLLREGAAAGA